MDGFKTWLLLALMAVVTHRSFSAGPFACERALDLVFVLDGSDSLTSINREKITSAVTDIIQNLPFNDQHFQVGLVTAASSVTYSLPLNSKKNVLLSEISKIDYPNSGNATDLGIRAAIDLLVNSTRDVSKVIVIITDGLIDNPGRTRQQVEAATSLGISIFVVGFGSISGVDLNVLAPPSRVFNAGDIKNLPSTLQNIASSICENDITKTVPTTSSMPTTRFESTTSTTTVPTTRFESTTSTTTVPTTTSTTTVPTTTSTTTVPTTTSTTTVPTTTSTTTVPTTTSTTTVPTTTSTTTVPTTTIESTTSTTTVPTTTSTTTVPTTTSTTTVPTTTSTTTVPTTTSTTTVPTTTSTTTVPTTTIESTTSTTATTLTTTQRAEVCSLLVLNSGLTILPAPDTCAQFLQCLPDLTYEVKDCGPGTLFNDVHRTCGYLSEYSCPAWGQCRPNQVQSFPALCCSQFYSCNDGSVSLENCPVGTVWRDNTRGCTSITSFDNDCISSTHCPTGNGGLNLESCEASGFSPEPSNICSFRRLIAPGNYVTQACAPGSSWDQTSCTCVSNPRCLPEVVTSAPGSACTAQVHINFNGGVRAISDVSGQILPMWIDSKVASDLRNTAVVFDGQSGSDRNLVYIPFFNNRDFPDGVAFQVTFKLRNPTNGIPYDILVNDYLGLCSKPSVYLTAVANGNQVTINFRIISKTEKEVTVSATVSGANQTDAWLRVTGIVQRPIVTGKIDVISSSGISLAPSQRMTTANIDSGIKTIGCGLAIGQGSGNVFTGEVEDLKIFECTNVLSLQD